MGRCGSMPGQPCPISRRAQCCRSCCKIAWMTGQSGRISSFQKASRASARWITMSGCSSESSNAGESGRVRPGRQAAMSVRASGGGMARTSSSWAVSVSCARRGGGARKVGVYVLALRRLTRRPATGMVRRDSQTAECADWHHGLVQRGYGEPACGQVIGSHFQPEHVPPVETLAWPAIGGHSCERAIHKPGLGRGPAGRRQEGFR
jgi:hypothetical protein